MGGFLQPTPTAEQRDTSRRTILVAIAVIVVLVGIVAWTMMPGRRRRPRGDERDRSE